MDLERDREENGRAPAYIWDLDISNCFLAAVQVGVDDASDVVIADLGAEKCFVGGEV